MLDSLYENVVTGAPSKVKGEWFNIRFIPDLFSGERYNIGVCFIDNEEKRHIKMLDEKSRIGCLFDQVASQNINFLISVVEESIEKSIDVIPSDQVIYSEKKYISGDSVEEILEYLFDETVPLGRKQDVRVHEQGEQISRETLRERMYDVIRGRVGILAERLIPQSRIIELMIDGVTHGVDIPFQGKGLLGGVESAVYKSDMGVKLKLLDAAMDLETAATIHTNDKLGMFILRAGEGGNLPSKSVSKIDNVIDDIAWRLKKRSVHVDVEEDINTLSDRAIDWADITAA